jgi:hypothetical protein
MDQQQQSGPTPPPTTAQTSGNSHLNRHSYITMAGPLIPPSNSSVRQYIMGISTSNIVGNQTSNSGRPIQSNLTALLQRHNEEEKQRDTEPATSTLANRDMSGSNEADSASGPSLSHHSAPTEAFLGPRIAAQPPITLPQLHFPVSTEASQAPSNVNVVSREPKHQQSVETSDTKPRR